MADEAASWNDLHGRFAVSGIDHSKLYSDRSGVHTNGVEEFFSRLPRFEIGHHHHIAGGYLVRCDRSQRGAKIVGAGATASRSGKCGMMAQTPEQAD